MELIFSVWATIGLPTFIFHHSVFAVNLFIIINVF